MTMFSDYIHALLAMVQPIGLRSSVTVESDRNIHPPARAQNGLQSVELTIPVRIQEATDLVAGPGRLGAWLHQNTSRILLETLGWQEISPAIDLRLAQATRQAIQTLEGLLGQENIAQHQVWLDFAQTVLSVAWDAQQAKAYSAANRKNARSQRNDFEELCQGFVTRLHTQYEAAQAASPSATAPMQVTWEPQALAALPAHALTYIKLLIVGHELASDQGLQAI